MTDDCLIAERFESVLLPESTIYCHPSRISNIYEPFVEEVRQPNAVMAADDINVRVAKTIVPGYHEIHDGGIKRKLKRLLHTVDRGKADDLGERLVFDARHSYNDNIAHLIHEHMVLLGYIKARLNYGSDDVIVLLNRDAPALAVKFFKQINYEVFLTDRRVSCNCLDIRIDETRHLLPFLAEIELSGWLAATPEKVFIPRKKSRRLKNEEAIFGTLKNLGYERFYFEDISMMEQWSIMRNAESVVAIHGAALGTLGFNVFRSPGKSLSLVELFSPGLVANVFRKYMAVLGGDWRGCRGKLTPDLIRDIDIDKIMKAHAFDDFELAPGVIERALAA
ncbi:MAG: glycosyltransferase family 61 protein [Hydrogenophilaceae bacterium]|nr:glycosyltransferase family 61 protein [Hydrogenophilaceae bacterium]